ncbi:MAG: nucleoside recognition protein [Prevotellaceae bacterium]|jgi:spore maturation protein SpmB|nr:nucleoside recognition protein [Prevotellaceae bacterium]
MNYSPNVPQAMRDGFRSALKTAWWMIRLTVTISLGVMLLQYFGIIALVSKWLTPLFLHIGLQGEAALVFITGALVNHYAAIAIIETIGFDARSITILALMCLCAHNLIVETAIQKKIGSSAVRMVVIRLLFAIISAMLLNAILPDSAGDVSTKKVQLVEDNFWVVLTHWALSTLSLTAKMFTIIVALTVLQRLLAELGAIRMMSKLLRPLLKAFGLPPKTSFLWIVAQTLGLAYGAAVMVEEKEAGKVSKRDLDLLNHHIAVSHSNIEDVMLFFSIGASLFWMFALRIVFAAAVVWERRFFTAYRQR